MNRVLGFSREKLSITFYSLIVAFLFYIFQSSLARLLIYEEDIESINYISVYILPYLNAFFVILKYYIIVCLIVYILSKK